MYVTLYIQILLVLFVSNGLVSIIMQESLLWHVVYQSMCYARAIMMAVVLRKHNASNSDYACVHFW